MGRLIGLVYELGVYHAGPRRTAGDGGGVGEEEIGIVEEKNP